MLSVRLIRSYQWLHDRLMQDAAPPSSYRWADPREDPDVGIFLVPMSADHTAPERLRTLRPKDYRQLYIFSQADNPVPWAPGIFTSLPAARATPAFAGGFYVLPGYYDEPGGVGEMLDQIGGETDKLWSFLGTVSNCPRVRRPIMALADNRGLAQESARWNQVRWSLEGEGEHRRLAAVRDFVCSVARAKFVVAPRGVGPSSMRLFEAMRAGRVPVIISDDWLPPPFVDWATCSVRIPEAQIDHLPSILREREDEAVQLGGRARAAWEAHFSPQMMVHQLVQSCIDIHQAGLSTRYRLWLSASVWRDRATLRRARQAVRGERLRLQTGARHVTDGRPLPRECSSDCQ